MADSDKPPVTSGEPQGKRARPKEEHHATPPSYDADVEGYSGISDGALRHPDDVGDARAFAEMIVDTVREGLLVLDLDLRVKAVNESFYNTFGVRPEETVGRLVYDLGDGQWDLPELRTLLEEILPHEKAFDDFEVERTFEGVGPRYMLLDVRPYGRTPSTEADVMFVAPDAAGPGQDTLRFGVVELPFHYETSDLGIGQYTLEACVAAGLVEAELDVNDGYQGFKVYGAGADFIPSDCAYGSFRVSDRTETPPWEE